MRRLSVAAGIIVFVFMCIPAFAQSKSNVDIKGWNEAEWGMTEAQLLAAFKGNIIKEKRTTLDDGVYRELKIPHFIIDGLKFDVFFEMSSIDDKLRRVFLMHGPASATDFSRFERLLTSKYGPAVQKDESRPKEGRPIRAQKTASWLLPSTKIELSYKEMPGIGLGSYMDIYYIDRVFTKQSTDKL
jgi:hypothetical protein